jgi:hypothetical protein
MSLRKRLIVFVLLFGSAVLTNIFALVYLARSISNLLDTIENIRQRQLVMAQMNAHLRNAKPCCIGIRLTARSDLNPSLSNS